MNQTELSAWLVKRGFAEPEPGYGHVAGDELAQALLRKFTIRDKTAPDECPFDCDYCHDE